MRASTARNMKSGKKDMSPEQREAVLGALKARFERNMNRHKGLEWAQVQANLEANAERLWSLNEMERTGGEPDVIGRDNKTAEYVFCDCSAESPKAAEVFATTAKRWTRGKKTNLKIAPLMWPRLWALSF